jgi:hypothetical protein
MFTALMPTDGISGRIMVRKTKRSVFSWRKVMMGIGFLFMGI